MPRQKRCQPGNRPAPRSYPASYAHSQQRRSMMVAVGTKLTRAEHARAPSPQHWCAAALLPGRFLLHSSTPSYSVSTHGCPLLLALPPLLQTCHDPGTRQTPPTPPAAAKPLCGSRPKTEQAEAASGPGLSSPLCVANANRCDDRGHLPRTPSEGTSWHGNPSSATDSWMDADYHAWGTNSCRQADREHLRDG